MGSETRSLKLVPALERSVKILDYIAKTRSYPSLSEISREFGIAKSSVHNLCNTMVHMELLIRRPDQTFQLGPHVMRWSTAFEQQSDVTTEFTAIWDQETELPGATITLTVLMGSEVVYIAARNSAVSHSLVEFRAGMRLPAAFTATGKAFLSHMSEYEVRRLFAAGLPEPLTSHSVQTIERLLEELDETRRNGFSYDDQQVAEGIVCFGASVLDASNRPIAGVAVSLPVDRMEQHDRSDIIQNVKRMATRLSHRMGADLTN